MAEANEDVLIPSGTTDAFRIAWLLSWPLRATAGYMLIYIVFLLFAEIIPWDEAYALVMALEERGSEQVFNIVAYVNLALMMLWSAFANRALNPFVRPKLQRGPVMAALWYIIPFASLFMPWLVVRELYRASRERTNWQNGEARLVGIWWLAAVFSSLGGIVRLYTDKAGGDLAYYAAVSVHAVAVAELTLQIYLFTRMTRWQRHPVETSQVDVF
jgi:hypothetical protein